MAERDAATVTAPRRRSARDAGRSPVLLVVGSGDPPSAPAADRVVSVDGGADVGRRPPRAAGRAAVALDEASVSGLHARIEPGPDDVYFVEDCNSTNGTVLDGRPVEGRAPLREGSLLFFGGVVAVFRTMTPGEREAVEADLGDPFSPVATLSPRLAAVCSKLRRLAPSSTEVLLLGETGVGKEVFARALHQRSGRTGPFVAVNCAALPRELVESELFGYERGAHSAAHARKGGLIESAEGGTLLLDELGEMPLEAQGKLLRFLQDHSYLPIGATKARHADVRIVAASSRPADGASPDIQDALLGRLGAEPIAIPALRERLEDVGSLALRFLTAAGRVRPFEAEAFEALFLYSWPHNVRELQKVVVEAELLSRGEESIRVEHLPAAIAGALDTGARASAPGAPPPDERPGGRDAERTERARIMDALAHCGGNQSRAARFLGIPRRTLVRRISQMGLPRPRTTRT